MIILKGVTKQYGGLAAVQDVSLMIPNESIYGIVGRRRAGKSTLLSIMSLLESPDAGEVYYGINGDERVDILCGERLRMKRRKTGMIFQKGNLFESRNASGNISYPLEVAGMTKKQIARRVDELLEIVHLQDKRTARLRELSDGQKQRVAIARALAGSPEILFCDETASALDPQTAESILELIRDIHDRFRLTVVLVAHQIGLIQSICDDIMVFDEGRIVEVGTVQQLFAPPKTSKERVYA
ncbi:MAG: ATP-binding cassette domain-containing protein [Spirochaetaceae bacterium]|jgi:D-methionine transport system ATP-binding protein|nr:ATP-binding cassette domain-containing protein [Spirochaetaceae bacterium]